MIMVIFQRNIPVISSAYFTNYNEQLINFGLTFVMCTRSFLSSMYDVRWVYIISFGVYALLYHFRGEHAAERFIIHRGSEHTSGCVSITMLEVKRRIDSKRRW